MSSREDYQLKRVLHAYHEAGHAVVWHVVGGLVEEVSIASSQAGYKGYCRFGFLLPQGDDHPSPTLTRFCGVNERGNSIQLLLVSDRTDESQ